MFWQIVLLVYLSGLVAVFLVGVANEERLREVTWSALIWPLALFAMLLQMVDALMRRW